MKANELMIGDFVLSKSDDKIYKINSIITQNDGSILFATEDGLHFDYMYDVIPLTYKILEKMDFKEMSPMVIGVRLIIMKLRLVFLTKK